LKIAENRLSIVTEYRKKITTLSNILGMNEGQKVVFHGEGDQEPGLEPGDVIIVLDEKDHAIFHRYVNS